MVRAEDGPGDGFDGTRQRLVNDINASACVTGRTWSGDGDIAYLLSGDGVSNIDLPNGSTGMGWRVNNASEVVGSFNLVPMSAHSFTAQESRRICTRCSSRPR